MTVARAWRRRWAFACSMPRTMSFRPVAARSPGSPATSDLVLTGEGRIDGQTARGKVIAGVARRAKAAGVPVVALAGSVAEGAEAQLRPEGLTAALSIVNGPLTVEEAMQAGYHLLG